MPQAAAHEPAVPADAAQGESVEEDNASRKAREANDQAQEATDAARIDQAEPAAASASVGAPETSSRKRQPKSPSRDSRGQGRARARSRILIELVTDYAGEEHGIEIRQVAGGFRMATKPEHHDVVRAFAKSESRRFVSLAALETLAVIAYKPPSPAGDFGIRGVDEPGVFGTLLDRSSSPLPTPASHRTFHAVQDQQRFSAALRLE